MFNYMNESLVYFQYLCHFRIMFIGGVRLRKCGGLDENGSHRLRGSGLGRGSASLGAGSEVSEAQGSCCLQIQRESSLFSSPAHVCLCDTILPAVMTMK